MIRFFNHALDGKPRKACDALEFSVMSSIIKSLRLLADPTRLRLLLLLEQEELSVAELQEILGMGQSRISAHLAQLRQERLVRDRRAGKNIYYGASDKNPFHAQFRDIVVAGEKEIPEAASDKTALQLVLRKRQDKAREYFNKLAGKFGRSYCPGRSWKGIAHLLLSLVGPITVADLGAGEGTLSQLIAHHAKKVIAVDNSEKMVEFGSKLAKEHGFKNLEYRHGDIQEPPIAASSVESRPVQPGASPRQQSRACRGCRASDFEKERTRRNTRSARAQFRAGPRALRRHMARLQRSATARNA